MDFVELCENRYSVRKFSDRQVEEEKINIILRSAQVSPTACNKQPQKIYALQSPEALEKLQKCKTSHFGETLAFIITVDKTKCWVREYDDQSSSYVDGSIVTTHMMLSAHDIGIGSTWIMHFIPDAVRSEFSIPENEEIISILVMGYPAPDSKPSSQHYDKKPLSETVVIL